MRKTVNAIIENWSADTDTRFGIVAYTDHGRESGIYPP